MFTIIFIVGYICLVGEKFVIFCLLNFRWFVFFLFMSFLWSHNTPRYNPKQILQILINTISQNLIIHLILNPKPNLIFDPIFQKLQKPTPTLPLLNRIHKLLKQLPNPFLKLTTRQVTLSLIFILPYCKLLIIEIHPQLSCQFCWWFLNWRYDRKIVVRYWYVKD